MIKRAIMINGLIRKILVLALLGLYFAPVAEGTLSSRIREVMNRKSQKNTTFAIRVIEADSGREIYGHNSQKMMIPASNMKIITSAAALHYLGGDYEYKTHVGMLGKSLVVIGGGDPLLGDEKTDVKNGRAIGWIFEDIIAGLRERKVRYLEDIYIDSTFFDDNRICENWPADQRNRWYEAEICGVNYNNNCIKMHVKRNGSRVSISVDPVTDYVKIVNQVKLTSKGNSQVGAYRNTEPNKLIVKGTCRTGASFDVAIERPGAFFGYMLYERLRGAGIGTKGKLVEKYVKNNRKIKVFRTYTTPISEVLIRCNKNSLGMAAEALVKTISAENTRGRINGEWPHGHTLISRYMASLKVSAIEYILDDGSGLSRENRLSARALTVVLHDMYKSKDRELFLDSLAVGGVDGTIGKYFGEPKYKGNIIGKTGYIDGVRSFSGVCMTANGDYIFSILTEGGNGYTRAAINDIAKAIVPSGT